MLSSTCNLSLQNPLIPSRGFNACLDWRYRLLETSLHIMKQTNASWETDHVKFLQSTEQKVHAPAQVNDCSQKYQSKDLRSKGGGTQRLTPKTLTEICSSFLFKAKHVTTSCTVLITGTPHPKQQKRTGKNSLALEGHGLVSSCLAGSAAQHQVL